MEKTEMKEQDPNTGWTKVDLVGMDEDGNTLFEASTVVERPTQLFIEDPEAFEAVIKALLQDNAPDDSAGMGIVNCTPIPAMTVH